MKVGEADFRKYTTSRQTVQMLERLGLLDWCLVVFVPRYVEEEVA